MSQSGSVVVYGLTTKVEASYNAGGALSTSTDGIQLAELPELVPSYAQDGSRQPPPATTGMQRRVPPTGKTAALTAKLEPKGAGAAYSASVVPNFHNLLRIAGFDAVGSFTGGSEKWTYTPTPGPTGYGSGVANAYARGELYPLTGAYADFLFSADGDVVPLMEFPIQALLGAVTDVAVPSITYPLATIDPPKSVGSTLLSLNGVSTLIVRKWGVKMQRQITPRLNQNAATGHAGYGVGRRNFTLEVTFETPTIATMDPLALYEGATQMVWSMQIGSVQYNRIKMNGSIAQIATAPKPDKDGPVPLTSLSIQLNPTVLGNNDEITIVTD